MKTYTEDEIRQYLQYNYRRQMDNLSGNVVNPFKVMKYLGWYECSLFMSNNLISELDYRRDNVDAKGGEVMSELPNGWRKWPDENTPELKQLCWVVNDFDEISSRHYYPFHFCQDDFGEGIGRVKFWQPYSVPAGPDICSDLDKMIGAGCKQLWMLEF